MKKIVRTPDDDLRYGAGYNGLSDVVDQIENVLAQVPGEADGADWHWVVKFKKGNLAKYGYITGGCDYTGWDCQSGMRWEKADSAKEAAKLATEAYSDKPDKQIQKQLLDQLSGKQPYGLRES